MYQSHMLVLAGCGGRHGDSMSSSNLHLKEHAYLWGVQGECVQQTQLLPLHRWGGVGWAGKWRRFRGGSKPEDPYLGKKKKKNQIV